MSEELKRQPEQAQQETEKPQVEIMQYSDEYKEQVKDLIFDVYEVERGRYTKGRDGRRDLDMIEERYQGNRRNFWVAVENGKVVGTIGLRNQSKEIASMHRFCVAKKFRGKEKGVSAKLFSTLLEFAENHGYKKIILGTSSDSKAAIKFYERKGFVKIESLPEELIKGASLSHNEIFFELDLENPKSEM